MSLYQPERSARGAVAWLGELAAKLGGPTGERVVGLQTRVRDEYTSWRDALMGAERTAEVGASAWADVASALDGIGQPGWAEVARSVHEANVGQAERIQAGEAGGLQGVGRALQETADDAGEQAQGAARYLPHALAVGVLLLFVYLARLAHQFAAPFMRQK